MMNYLKIFSPATVANVSCGFDALGLAVDGIGDEMTFTKTSDKKVVISQITGANLPYETHLNAASAVAQKMLQDVNADFGLAITLHKGFIPGSGLGSSAASAAGAAFGVNQFLNQQFSKTELTKYAMYGEEVACGTPIADNVAAAIFGGFVLARSVNPLEIIDLPVPDGLYIALIHPQVTVKTQEAREVLPDEIPLAKAVKQWANVGGLVSGLYQNDYTLIANSLQDFIVEPARKHLIPHFDEVKHNAIKAGALGAGISGSGPTVFALCKGKQTVKQVAGSMHDTYKNKGIIYNVYHSKINTEGVKVISDQ